MIELDASWLASIPDFTPTCQHPAEELASLQCPEELLYPEELPCQCQPLYPLPVQPSPCQAVQPSPCHPAQPLYPSPCDPQPSPCQPFQPLYPSPCQPVQPLYPSPCQPFQPLYPSPCEPQPSPCQPSPESAWTQALPHYTLSGPVVLTAAPEAAPGAYWQSPAHLRAAAKLPAVYPVPGVGSRPNYAAAALAPPTANSYLINAVGAAPPAAACNSCIPAAVPVAKATACNSCIPAAVPVAKATAEPAPAAACAEGGKVVVLRSRPQRAAARILRRTVEAPRRLLSAAPTPNYILQRRVTLRKGPREPCAITKQGLQVLIQAALQPSTFTCAEASELAAALQLGHANVTQDFSSAHGGALDRALPKLTEDLWNSAMAMDCAEGRVQPYENRLELVSGDVFSFSVVVGTTRRVAYRLEIKTSHLAV